MVDYINNGEKLEERSINLEDIRDKFLAYSGYLPFINVKLYRPKKNEDCFFCYI